MSAYDRQITAEIAFAKVTGTDATLVANRGFVTITRTGAGVYTCKREKGGTGADLPAESVVSAVQCNSTSARHGTTVESAVDTTTVRTFDAAGSAADSDFTITVRRATNND